MKRIIFLLLGCSFLYACKPAVFGTEKNCTYNKDLRYINVAIDKKGVIYLEDEPIDREKFPKTFMELKSKRVVQVQKKFHVSRPFVAVNLCVAEGAPDYLLTEVREAMEK